MPPHDASSPYLSVVVPAYNEADNLEELRDRVVSTIEPLGSFELIIIDDGSTDQTWAVLCDLAGRDQRVRGLRLLRNFGQHPAVTAGFRQARGDIIVTLDADLQNPPEEIPKLVARLGPDCDVASGWRQVRHDSWSRTLPSRLANVIMGRVTGVRLHDYGCMLRAYKRRVIDLLEECPEVNRFITALVSWLGVSIVEVPVEHRPRERGTSRYGFWRLLKMNFDIITGFSTGLLQFVSLTGLLFSAAGLAAGVVLIVWRLLHGSGPVGQNTFMALTLFMGGLQLAAIGVVGEYVGRMYMQVQGRPYFIVGETTDTPGVSGATSA